ncbi:hypothetical protein AHAS_Ahas09G0250600 [Arachis hypogaea]
MEASAMVEQLRLKPGVRNSAANPLDPGANQNVNAGKSVSAISHIGVLSDNMVADIAIGATPNAQGVGGKGFSRLVKDLCNRFHSGFLCLLETHISGAKAENVAQKFGFPNWHLVEGCGFLGGIWLMWNGSFWDVHVIESHR